MAMATTTAEPVVMKSQLAWNDDAPLLGGIQVEKSDRAFPPVLAAHRRRLVALLRAAWDSGITCVCLAALVFSFAALFVKLMGSIIPVFQIVAVRSVISFIICAAYAHAAAIKPLFGHRPNLRFLISRGLFGAAAMTSYYFCIKMLPLADAVTLFFLNPAITAVAAWAIMREPLGMRGVGGVLISLCGLVLLTQPPFLFGHEAGNQTAGGSGGSGLHGDGGTGVGTAGASIGSATINNSWDKERMLGSMFGLLSALLSAGAFISIRYIGKSEPALVVSVYFHISAATSSLIPLAAGLPAPAVWPSGVQWALLLGVSFCSFWGQILIGRGFQLLNAARASAINLTQVVYSYLLGLIFLHEQLKLLGGAGSVLIAAGAVLVNLRPKAPPHPTAATAATTEVTMAIEAATAANAEGGSTGKCSAELEGAPGPVGMKGAEPVDAGSGNDVNTTTEGECSSAKSWRQSDDAPAAVAVRILEMAGTRKMEGRGACDGKDGEWTSSWLHAQRKTLGKGDGTEAEALGMVVSERQPLVTPSPAELSELPWEGAAATAAANVEGTRRRRDPYEEGSSKPLLQHCMDSRENWLKLTNGACTEPTCTRHQRPHQQQYQDDDNQQHQHCCTNTSTSSGFSSSLRPPLPQLSSVPREDGCKYGSRDGGGCQVVALAPRANSTEVRLSPVAGDGGSCSTTTTTTNNSIVASKVAPAFSTAQGLESL